MQRLRWIVWMFLLALVSGLAMQTGCMAQSANPFSSAQPGYPRWSPFSGVRWDSEKPLVRIENAWYEIVSIHGVDTTEILQFCEDNGWDTRERFAEDLVQIILLMEHEIGRKTDLVLLDEDGEVVATSCWMKAA